MRSWVCFLMLSLIIPASSRAAPPPNNATPPLPKGVADRTRKATAVIILNARDKKGTAVCIDSSGLFVTTMNLHHPTQITILLDSGEPTERSIPALPVREGQDFSFFQAQEKGSYASLELAGPQDRRSAAAAYLAGHEILTPGNTAGLKNQRIQVREGNISSEIQRGVRSPSGLPVFEQNVAINHSGGPVVDFAGKLTGIAFPSNPGGRPAVVMPVEKLRHFLSCPDILFDPEPIPKAKLAEARRFTIRAVPFHNAPPPDAVELILSDQSPSRTILAQPAGGDTYQVTVAPSTAAAKNLETIEYSVVAKRGNEILSQLKGTIGVELAPATPMAPLPITPAKLDGEKKTIELGAPVADVVPAAGGRYLILHLQRLQQLAVFDVSEARIIRTLPMASPHIIYAAGADTLVVILPDQGVVQRWSLKTFERELSRSITATGGVVSMTIGQNSRGPALVFGEYDIFFLDPITLKRLNLSFFSRTRQDPLDGLGANTSVIAKASTDGRSFAIWRRDAAQSRPHYVILRGQSAEVVESAESRSGLDMTSDGGIILGYPGFLSADLAPIPGTDAISSTVPCDDAAYFLRLDVGVDAYHPKPVGVTLFSTNFTALVALPQLEPEEPTGGLLPFIDRDKRVRFIRAANLLVSLGRGNSTLVLNRFNITEALEAAGTDYLFATSSPPRFAVKGQSYNYPLQVLSKRGGLKYRIEHGPDGLTISNTGLLHWQVPADYKLPFTSVVVAASDATGQTIEHRIVLITE